MDSAKCLQHHYFSQFGHPAVTENWDDVQLGQSSFDRSFGMHHFGRSSKVTSLSCYAKLLRQWHFGETNPRSLE
jgi:hypothetical protein